MDRWRSFSGEWGEYFKNATGIKIDPFWCGPVITDGQFHFGVNIVAIGVILLVSAILILGGVAKSAKLNFFLVILKLTLLTMFLAFGIRHVNPANKCTQYHHVGDTAKRHKASDTGHYQTIQNNT